MHKAERTILGGRFFVAEPARGGGMRALYTFRPNFHPNLFYIFSAKLGEAIDKFFGLVYNKGESRGGSFPPPPYHLLRN